MGVETILKFENILTLSKEGNYYVLDIIKSRLQFFFSKDYFIDAYLSRMEIEFIMTVNDQKFFSKGNVFSEFAGARNYEEGKISSKNIIFFNTLSNLRPICMVILKQIHVGITCDGFTNSIPDKIIKNDEIYQTENSFYFPSLIPDVWINTIKDCKKIEYDPLKFSDFTCVYNYHPIISSRESKVTKFQNPSLIVRKSKPSTAIPRSMKLNMFNNKKENENNDIIYKTDSKVNGNNNNSHEPVQNNPNKKIFKINQDLMENKGYFENESPENRRWISKESSSQMIPPMKSNKLFKVINKYVNNSQENLDQDIEKNSGNGSTGICFPIQFYK